MPAILNGPYGKHVLKSGYTVLGRDPDCDIQLEDPRLSRHHARFFWHEGTLKIEDLNSHNGILLNGEVVLGTSNVFHGNLVAIGPAVFDISIDESMVTQEHERSTAIEQTKSEQFVAEMETENMDPPSPDSLPLPQTSVHTSAEDPTSKIALTQRRNNTNNDVENDPRFAATVTDSNLFNNHSSSQQFKPSTSAADRHATAPALQANGQTTVNFEEAGEATGDYSSVDQETKSASQIDPEETSKIAALLPETDRTNSGLNISSSSTLFGPLRFCAGILEATWNITFALLIALPILCAGYTIALLECQASMYNNLPTLDYQSSSADWQSIAWSLTSVDGWERAYQLSKEIYEIFPDAFIWIFSAITLGTLCVTLYLLVSLVAATTIKGAPLWHRICGLCILEQATGFYPTPLRCCIRWLFAIILAPISLPCALFNIRSPHDFLSGCSVKNSADHH